VCENIHHILPIIIDTYFNEIQWPSEAEQQDLCVSAHFPTAWGAVDATIHPRNRPKIGQRQYYRGDKRCHFISTQIICDLLGRIRHVETGFLGHNNDVSNWCYSFPGRGGMIAKGTTLLADDGYPEDEYLERPADFEQGGDKLVQRQERQIVEAVNAFLKRFVFNTMFLIALSRFYAVAAKSRVHQAFQPIVVFAACCLAARQLNRKPLVVWKV
jgi:hypothetical protein